MKLKLELLVEKLLLKLYLIVESPAPGDYVVFAIDAHEEGDPFHPEANLFPPHNIIGTSGKNLYGKLADVYHEHQSKENVYYFDKTRYMK